MLSEDLFLQSFLLLLLLMAAVTMLLLRKKSVATMLALSHHSSQYQLFTCLYRQPPLIKWASKENLFRVKYREGPKLNIKNVQ